MTETHYPEIQIIKVTKIGGGKYARLRNDAEGEFYRYYHKDGSYSLLPVPPAPKLAKREKESMPISCQQGTPLGGIEK